MNMNGEFIRCAAVGLICFWLGMVLTMWYIGRDYK